MGQPIRWWHVCIFRISNHAYSNRGFHKWTVPKMMVTTTINMYCSFAALRRTFYFINISICIRSCLFKIVRFSNITWTRSLIRLKKLNNWLEFHSLQSREQCSCNKSMISEVYFWSLHWLEINCLSLVIITHYLGTDLWTFSSKCTLRECISRLW